MNRRSWIAALTAGLMSLNAAHALEAPDDRSYVTGMASYVEPDSDRNADHGYGATVLFGIPLNDYLVFEPTFFGNELEREVAVNDGIHDFQYALGIDANLGISLGKSPDTNFYWRPFGLLGVGAMLEDTLGDDDVVVYADAGLGMLFGLTENVALRLEGRGTWVFNDTTVPNDGEGRTVNVDGFNDGRFSLGLQFALGGTKEVPVVEPDSDGDTVPDSRDECPGTPLGTRVDAKGCKIEDDSCGGDCDQDGVINQNDHCPNTLPGLQVDARGCALKAQSIVLQGVFFDFDKATLQPQSFPVLDAAAAAMLGQPTMRVELAGHTDWKGSDQYNKRLSERRVETVRQYLISRGVQAYRLEAYGYGESVPVATNETDAGRALNRRVEFIILQQ